MEIKIPFYNILNMLLTGFVFIGCLLLQYIEEVIFFINGKLFFNLSAIDETLLIIILTAIAYEVGLILNRFGSVILEPILKKLIPFDDRYKVFQEKAKEFPIMNILSREYALSRTGMGEFIILSIFSWKNEKYGLMLIFLIVSSIFYLSCKKHASKIVKLMK